MWKRKQSYKFSKCREYHGGSTKGGKTPRHIIIKWTKIKEKTLKATREKQQITYKRISVRLSADFSTDTLQSRREWHNLFKVMKRKSLQPRILYPARFSFTFDREIKSLQTNNSVPPNSFTTNSKGTSLGGKGRKVHQKGKHTVKVGNHPHTDMISKTVVRGGEYKCKISEVHLKLRSST